jgi:1-acyl-sn-glycerol-3-phosphate acyltransferase
MPLHRPMAHFWAYFILKLFRIHVDISGVAILAERKRRIIIVNHQSNLEILWPCLIMPHDYFAIGKKEILYIPFFNLLWWASAMILVDRSNKENAMRTMKTVEERLIKEHSCLLIAPEGTRANHGELLPFKKGAFHIALKTGVSIYPIVASGAGKCMPKGALLPMPGTIHVRCLDPIDTSAWTLESLDTEIEKIRTLMQSALVEIDKQG